MLVFGGGPVFNHPDFSPTRRERPYRMIDIPLFYLIAVPAVLVVGISKGGFGSGLGILAVPSMALVVSPVQAAGIMLPILCLMDLVGVWSYRRQWDPANMKIIVPAAGVGIVIGTLTFDVMDESTIRLIIGGIALSFAADHWIGRRSKEPAGRSTLKGGFWATVAGFTSFVAHAGGPPLSVYLIPQRLDRALFVGTTVIFFTAVNYAKLLPYWWLGQLAPGNLATSLVLMPLAPIGVILGIRLRDKISPVMFYETCYILLSIAGLKLSWDGISALMG